MKQYFFAASIILISCMSAQAQVSLGLKGGINSQLSQFEDITLNNNDNSYQLGVENFKFGTQFGAYLRIGNRFFVQPEVTLNSNRADVRIKESNAVDIVRSEKYQYLAIPVLVGATAGPFRLYGGPVGHYYLSSKSELVDWDGYNARFKQMTWGWQAGLTIGKGRISGDIRYEGNFSKYGNHINFFGEQYNFSETPARLIVGLNLKLF